MKAKVWYVGDAVKGKSIAPWDVLFLDMEDMDLRSVPNAVRAAAQEVTKVIDTSKRNHDPMPIIAVVEPEQPLRGAARETLGRAGAFVLRRPESLYLTAGGVGSHPEGQGIDKEQAFDLYLRERFV